MQVGVSIDSGVARHEGEFSIPIDLKTMQLNPGASVHWKAELSSTLPSGLYTLDFATDASDENAQPVTPHASRFRFEVRDQSSDAMPEIVRRRAMRAYVAGSFDLAERDARALLALHPNSLEAYMLLGRVAEDQGRAPAARAALERALALAQGGNDKLQRNMSASLMGETIAYLRSQLAKVSIP